MMLTRPGEPLDLSDPALDAPLIEALVETPVTRPSRSRRWRRLIDWSATSAPVALLLLAGIALGRYGINLLSSGTLSLLAPVVPVALAALGVLVGLSVRAGRTGDRRVPAAAFLDAALTLLLVSTGVAVLALAGWSAVVQPFWTVVIGAGICAASSLTLPTGNSLEPRTAATRVIELGVVLPIAVAGVLLAALRAGTAAGTLILIVQAASLTLALALAAWLLLTRAATETEERVLTVSALLLVGGVADALSTSALFGGVVAGVFWRFAGRRPPETIGRDVLFAQHPLLVVVLLTAGATATFSPGALALGAAYVALRVVGRLAGGWAIRRLRLLKAPRDLSRRLLPPGVFGVAFALNVATGLGGEPSILLPAVVIGTIGSEIVAFLLPPRRADA
jgi:hypothetical protein